MKTIDVVIVRVYVMESSHLLKNVQIRGLSVFRAISGYGATSNHTTSLLDLSLDLSLAIEFFDSKDKIDIALEYLSTIIKHEHIIFWQAKADD